MPKTCATLPPNEPLLSLNRLLRLSPAEYACGTLVADGCGVLGADCQGALVADGCGVLGADCQGALVADGCGVLGADCQGALVGEGRGTLVA